MQSNSVLKINPNLSMISLYSLFLCFFDTYKRIEDSVFVQCYKGVRCNRNQSRCKKDDPITSFFGGHVSMVIMMLTRAILCSILYKTIHIWSQKEGIWSKIFINWSFHASFHNFHNVFIYVK